MPIVVLLNNSVLGMVAQWQRFFFKGRYAEVKLGSSPDFVKLAEAYGAVGLRASKPDEVEDVIKKALSVSRPVIMEFLIEKDECVYPMVPAGAPISNMMLL